MRKLLNNGFCKIFRQVFFFFVTWIFFEKKKKGSTWFVLYIPVIKEVIPTGINSFLEIHALVAVLYVCGVIRLFNRIENWTIADVLSAKPLWDRIFLPSVSARHFFFLFSFLIFIIE